MDRLLVFLLKTMGDGGKWDVQGERWGVEGEHGEWGARGREEPASIVKFPIKQETLPLINISGSSGTSFWHVSIRA